MPHSLMLKLTLVPILLAAAWLLAAPQVVRACTHGSFCDHGWFACATGYGADCATAEQSAHGQINSVEYSACPPGENLCWRSGVQWDACTFDGTQYSVSGCEDFGCGGCL